MNPVMPSLSSAPSLAAAPAASPVSSVAQRQDRGREQAFARVLGRARDARTSDRAHDASRAASADEVERPARSDAKAQGAKAREPSERAAADQRPARADAAPARSGDAKAAAQAQSDDATRDDATRDDAAAALGELDALLLQGSAQAAAAATAQPVAADAAASGDSGDATTTAGGGAIDGAGNVALALVQNEAASAMAATDTDTDTSSVGPDNADKPAAAAQDAAQPSPLALPPGAPNVATNGAAAPLATKPAHAQPPTLTAALQAPVDTPAFAPALAAQVRWWAQDGVQQAQLTLNPPEMGPVTVKIVVHDGRDARIDFSADLAATRGAIEAALPVLAAALDESGLKLSGGGVHDGAAQRQADWHAAAAVTHRTPGRGAGHDGAASGVSVARVATPRGLVDLLA